jgi:hypothetical protein
MTVKRKLDALQQAAAPFPDQSSAKQQPQPCVPSMLDGFMSMTSYLRTLYSEDLVHDQEERAGIFVLDAMIKKPRSRRCEGDRKYNRFLDAFSVLKINDEPLVISAPAAAIIRHLAQSFLPQFFGRDFGKHRTRIVQEYVVDRFYKAVIGIMPRRFGKTCIAAAIESIRMYIVGGEAGVFSRTEAQTKIFLDYLKGFYRQLVDVLGAPKIIQENALEFRTASGARCRAFAGRPKNARGHTFAVIYVDEAVVVPEENAYSTIFPMFRIKNAVVVIISSPSDNSNSWLWKCGQLKYADGSPVFARVTYTRMCEECKAADKMECPHSINPGLEWLEGDENEEFLRQVYSTNPRRYRIEILGEADENAIDVFSAGKLRRLEKRPRIDAVTGQVTDCFVTIDPNGGGETSDTAITAGILGAEGHVVVSLG